MKNLTTDVGTNWIGLLILIYEGVDRMPEGTAKTVLTFMTLTAAALIAFSIKGSGLSKEQGVRVLDAAESIEEVLKRGRDETPS